MTDERLPVQFLQMAETERGDHCQYMKRPNCEGRGAMSVELFPSQRHPVGDVRLACRSCHPRRRVGAVCLDEELAHPWRPIQIVTATLQEDGGSSYLYNHNI